MDWRKSFLCLGGLLLLLQTGCCAAIRATYFLFSGKTDLTLLGGEPLGAGDRFFFMPPGYTLTEAIVDELFIILLVLIAICYAIGLIYKSIRRQERHTDKERQ